MKNIRSIPKSLTTFVGQYVVAIEHKVLRPCSPYKLFFVFSDAKNKEISTFFRVKGVSHADYVMETIKPKKIIDIKSIFLHNQLTNSIVKNYSTQE